jgi:hypothetical protein
MFDQGDEMAVAARNRVSMSGARISYEDYSRAYKVGYKHRLAAAHASWIEAEPMIESSWDALKGTSRLAWHEARHVVKAGWQRAHENCES